MTRNYVKVKLEIVNVSRLSVFLSLFTDCFTFPLLLFPASSTLPPHPGLLLCIVIGFGKIELLLITENNKPCLDIFLCNRCYTLLNCVHHIFLLEMLFFSCFLLDIYMIYIYNIFVSFLCWWTVQKIWISLQAMTCKLCIHKGTVDICLLLAYVTANSFGLNERGLCPNFKKRANRTCTSVPVFDLF